ncbi:hypothetical protein F5Y12DRAFT_751417 [Xylaria sp. FL1777]|nr:hypothetical protein F5Y12DRAFT_751417 [Xylaria sp. FL1777]
MKLLAVYALFAGAAQAFTFVKDYNYASYHTVGTDFVISWEIENKSDTFRLELATYLVKPKSGITGPYYNSTDSVLSDTVKYTDGSYTWPIELVEGREGADWFYAFIAYADDEFTYSQDFHVQTASS